MFEWINIVIILVVAVIFGLIGYGYTMYKKQTSEDKITDFIELIDLDLFTTDLPQKDNYIKIKSELPIANDSDSEEVKSQRFKTLQAALLKRSIAIVEKAYSVQTEINKVQSLLQTNNPLPKHQHEQIQATTKVIEQEIDEIKEEANQLKAKWGETIIQQAADLSIGLKKRQEARKQAEIDAKKKAKAEEIKKAQEQRQQQEQLLREAKIAEKNYQKLLEEEERNANKQSKKQSKKAK